MTLEVKANSAHRASKHEWRFKPGLPQGRSSLLFNAPAYERLVNRIANAARLKRAYAEGKGATRCWRAVAVFVLPCALVDQFHNGPSGYRAQYLKSIATGERANRRIVEALSEAALRRFAGNPKPGIFAQIMFESFHCRDAKVWIYQGRWFRAPHWYEPRLVISQ